VLLVGDAATDRDCPATGFAFVCAHGIGMSSNETEPITRS